MDDKVYSIGETCRILNISVTTLRHYDKLNLVTPAKVDNRTGYRYYTLDQFHRIDRIRYLQSFGFSLSDVSQMMADGKVESALPFLQRKLRDYREELDALQKKEELIQWYLDFFTYTVPLQHMDTLYQKSFPERYVLAVPYESGRSVERTDVDLLKLKNTPGMNQLLYRRQWGAFLDYAALIEGNVKFLETFVYLAEKPSFPSKYFRTIPAGIYCCFGAKLLTQSISVLPQIRHYFNAANITPGMVVANEFEDNFQVFTDAVYEIQIQIDYT